MGNGFRELRVWQEAKALAVEVYQLIRRSPLLDKDWGLKDQMQRAAVSVPSNIAEGDARKSDKDSIRFFHIALGSLSELITQVEIARMELLARSLGALVKSRKECSAPKA